MLLDFTIGNYGPFREDATLSMDATRVGEHKENLLDVGSSRKGVLSSALIFGPNGAGKTFISNALMALRLVVRTVDEDIPDFLYTPYRVSASCRESPVRMRIRLILDGILYDYRVEYETGKVTYESLYYYPNKKAKRVFTRTEDEGYKGAKKSVMKMTTSGKTYLAMAALTADPICAKVRNAILGDIVILSPELDELVQRSCRSVGDDPKRKAVAIKALAAADFGISDFSYKERMIKLSDVKQKIPPEVYESALKSYDEFPMRDIFLRHDFTSPEADEEGRTIPMRLESAGTSCMFGLTDPLMDVLENGKVLVMDELGSHLHPLITRWIVKQFSSPNNPNGAQLIANTHDIGLMDIRELLRRDQIWFVNKSREDGSSELYCLSDFEGVRSNADVMIRYLDGRFDAVPAVRHRGVIG